MGVILQFRIRLAPRWDALTSRIKEAALQHGWVWPKSVKPLQFASMYSLTLSGKQTVDGDNRATRLDVTAWQPPNEPLVAEGLSGFTELRVSLGVRQKKLWTQANTAHQVDFDKLAPMLTGDGLVMHGAQSALSLADIPYQAILDVMAAVASKEVRLAITRSDHIVEHLAVPPQLQGFSLSRWRGDASYRLSNPGVDLEVWVTSGQN